MESGISRSVFKSHLKKQYPDRFEEIDEAFEVYRNLLFETNQVMNLTAINDADEVREKHFLDSLLLEPMVKENAMVADIGSGAGFPGLPLAIVRNDVQVVCIEPTQKRCSFMMNVVNALDLKNVKILNKRAEDCQDLKESFDVVTARAVAALPVLLELCTPLVKVGGDFIAMKGSNAQEELNKSLNAIKALNLNQPQVIESELPTAGNRIHYLFNKDKACPSMYPREYKYIKKKAL